MLVKGYGKLLCNALLLKNSSYLITLKYIFENLLISFEFFKLFTLILQKVLSLLQNFILVLPLSDDNHSEKRGFE